MDGEAYAPLLAADRSMFAWEWLRRVPKYRAEAIIATGIPDLSSRPACADPAVWGLLRFEDPELGVPSARPIWSHEADPYVLTVKAQPSRCREDEFDLEAVAHLATMFRSSEGLEHLLLSDGFRTIRLDNMRGTLTKGPVTLGYSIAGMASARRPITTLRRLLALSDKGGLAGALHKREARAHRWILELRAHDALASGASQRDIAAVLFSGAARLENWRIDRASLRAQAQRLVRRARSLSGGGHLKLIEGR